MKCFSISDLHFGSPASRPEDVLDFLSREEVRHGFLIVNGDLLDGHGKATLSLSPTEWRVLLTLRRRDPISWVWIPGNHDQWAEGVASLLGQVTFLALHYWEAEGKKTIFTHGHQDPLTQEGWDPYLSGYSLPTELADIGEIVVGAFSEKSAVWWRRKRKYLFRADERVNRKADDFRQAQGADYIVCGHTHFALNHAPYMNQGSWTEETCTYVEVGEDGIPILRSFYQ